jgi:hypothetical protein
VTEEQQRTIGAIACLTLLRGRPPVLRELAEAWGVSKWGAACRLHWLEKKGLWRKSDRSLTELGLRSAVGLPRGAPRPVKSYCRGTVGRASVP